jgi:hypothetical protein
VALPFAALLHAIGSRPPGIREMLMKLLVEILLAIFLHPIAWVLCVINIVGRTDMGGIKKVLWIIITFVWGIGPILYLLLGDGTFW